MRRLLTSALLVVGAAGAVALGTRSFFSDSESSVGNVFAAGTIDLKIGNVSYYNGVASTETSWTLRDLTIEKFFNFLDVKPGDLGQDVIEVQVGSNPAYVCANVQVTENSENGLMEPEVDLADTEPTGELADELNFAFWNDDGDNVYETGETLIVEGPASGVLTGGTLALADSDENNVGGVVPAGIPAEQSFYIGKAWCFGALTLGAVAPGSGDVVTNPGYTCDGSEATNIAQSDRLVGNLSFYAVQTRNNEEFQCEDSLFPSPSGSPSPSPSASPDTIVEVTSVDATPSASNWVFYNDETDTVDTTLGSFVAGPGTPPAGTGSVQMSVSGTQRRNLATYQFSGTPLANITTLKFNTYQPSSNPGASTRAIYLNFNVDFNLSDTWQSRLVYVPSANGSVSEDTWQEWDALGSSQWLYSGANWPAPNAQPGTTPKTWTQILTDYPSVRVRVTDSHWGFRAGEPYADGFTGNIDKFTLGVLGNNTVFDFEN